MKIIKVFYFALFMSSSFVFVSCSGGTATKDVKDSNINVMTTELLIKEANELGEAKFKIKYPAEKEIELNGEARFPATWEDKIAVKFGPDLNNLPIIAEFLFTENGGSKQATDDQITSGKMLHFKGKVGLTFFDDEGKLSRLSLMKCVVQ